jgi:signal transduction histidine kinase
VSVDGLKKVLTKPDASKNEQERATELRATDVSVICHDLRAHLSPVKICAEMLKSHISGPLNEKQEKMVETIHRCADRLEDLIRDISDVHKLESRSLTISRDEVDVQGLMDDCATALRQFILEKQIELKIEVGMHGKIHVDKNRIRQVLVNLVKNAVDYVPQTNGKIPIQVEKDRSNLLFTIEDNGEGMMMKDLEKIFTKFYKGDSTRPRKYGGSGLGLAISKGIISEHGGKIWADSKLGHGSVFRFTLPL